MSTSTTFSLVGKGLKLNTAEDIKPHIAPLVERKDWIEVHFAGNTIGVEAAEALADALRSQKSLKVRSEIPPALTALCNALLEIPSLIEVDLSDNAFGGRSVEPMVPLLSQHPTLQILKLSNNGLGPAGGTVIAKAIHASAQNAQKSGRQPNFTRIICGRNRLEDGSSEAWSAALKAHAETLLEFRAYQNGIRMNGVQNLARGLRSCSHLEHLDLQDNTAAQKGSRAIAASLPSWSNLIELNLSDCLLRPKGAVAIALALNKGGNGKLSKLRLQSDEVDAKAIEILAQAAGAGHLSSLALIELNGNRVEADDPSVVKLVEALAAHGHEDVLDEIDDVEEVDEEEEEDEEDDEEDEADAAEPKADADKSVDALADSLGKSTLNK